MNVFDHGSAGRDQQTGQKVNDELFSLQALKDMVRN